MIHAAKSLVAVALLVAVASCAPWDEQASMPIDATPLDVARPGLAVAPVIGVPIEASERLTQGITNAAAARGLPLARDNLAAGFDYVLEGTASARQTADGTVIAFAWDLTDADGIRHHRFIDTQLVPTRTPEAAWSTAGNAALSQVAMKAADQLAGFYGRQAGLFPVSDADRITTAALTPTSQATQQAKRPLPIKLEGPITLHLREVAGEPRTAPPVLGPALRAALQTKGANLVAAPEPGIMLVTGSMVVRPSSTGGSAVTLQWDVTRAGGAPVGSIVQERIFGAGEIETAWATAGVEAARDAARAVYALVSPDRDTRATTAALNELRGFTPPDSN